MLTEQRRTLRATAASAAARAARRPDDPKAQAEATDARRDYYALALEDHIARVIADAPPLTDEQRQKLASLLRGAADV